MDPVRNPFAPGAGTPPPELAGRDESARNRANRARASAAGAAHQEHSDGRSARCRQDRAARSHARRRRSRRHPHGAHRSAGRPLAAGDARAAIAAGAVATVAQRAGEGVGAAGAARAGRLREGAEGQVPRHRSRVWISNRNPASPTTATSNTICRRCSRRSAQRPRRRARRSCCSSTNCSTSKKTQLAALITALHRTAQRRLPVVLVGAGLPQLRGQMGRAKSYAERLFDFPEIGPLIRKPTRASRSQKPAPDEGVAINEDALRSIVRKTQGYPYFLQEWGKHAWDAATKSPITRGRCRSAHRTARSRRSTRVSSACASTG